MENSKKNTITMVGGVIILILSVISFVFIPALGRQSSGGKKQILGKWKGKTLENAPDGLFIRQYRQIYHTAEQQGFLNGDNQQQQQFLLKQMGRTAFRASMVQFAAEQEALNAGFYLPNKTINKALIPFYSDANGVYSEKIYEQTSEQERQNRRQRVVEYLTSQRFIEDLFGSYDNKFGLKTSTAETAFIKKMAETQQSFNYVVFEETRFPKENIRKYGNEHADLFAKHNLLLLTFTAQDEAEKILKALKNEELKFEDAVITNSTKTGTDSTGKLFDPYRTTVNRTFPESQDLDTVLKLKTGELSPVVKTASGYAIVKCTGETEPADFSLSQTTDRVFDYMKANDRGIIEDYLEQQAKEFSAFAKKAPGVNALKNAAAKKDLVLRTSNPFSVNYGNVSILPTISTQADTAFISLTKNETFFTKAFGLQSNDISEPVIAGSNVIVLEANDTETTSEEVQNKAGDTYNQYASFWYYQYPFAMFTYQQLPWAQQTFVDFILESPNFTDSFDQAMN